MRSELFALLLRDTAELIRPLPVTMVFAHQKSSEIDPATHPHLNTILVLSDLTRLFETSPSLKTSSMTRPDHVTHKLAFYAAHILSTPSPVLRALAKELLQSALVYQRTSAQDGIQATTITSVRKEDNVTGIEEL